MENPQMVPFLFTNCSHFLKNVTIFVEEILVYSEMAPFQTPFSSFPRSKGGLILRSLRGLNEKFSNGTFFVDHF